MAYEAGILKSSRPHIILPIAETHSFCDSVLENMPAGFSRRTQSSGAFCVVYGNRRGSVSDRLA